MSFQKRNQNSYWTRIILVYSVHTQAVNKMFLPKRRVINLLLTEREGRTAGGILARGRGSTDRAHKNDRGPIFPRQYGPEQVKLVRG